MANHNNELVLENVRIVYPNFKGAPAQIMINGKNREVNTDGSRKSNVTLDPMVAQELLEQGFNVKLPTEENPNRAPYLPIVLSKGPNVQQWVRIALVDNGNGRFLDITDPNQLAMLDDITPGCRVNAVLSPYYWDVDGKSGITAYTKKLYIYLDDVDPELAPSKLGFEKDINFL